MEEATKTDSIEDNKSSVSTTRSLPPFRKKAITSIERTRKLSILLKHQHSMVSAHCNKS